MSDFGLQSLVQYGADCIPTPSSSEAETDVPTSSTSSSELTLRSLFGPALGLDGGQVLNFSTSHGEPAVSEAAAAPNMAILDFNSLLNNGPIDMGLATMRNSSKTLKCPKCNWHYKYQETLEIHMKEKHSETEVRCAFCAENRQHPKLARGETYSCGYKPYRCELCKYRLCRVSCRVFALALRRRAISAFTCKATSICTPCKNYRRRWVGVVCLVRSRSSVSNMAAQNSGGVSNRAQLPTQQDKTFVCGVCANFSSDSIRETLEHAEKVACTSPASGVQDRSRPHMGDVSVMNGMFICHLCPYKTNLKANFQLHTRTDKHIQRVQMVNHIREGGAQNANLSRLAAAKGPFQVLCRPCQEILPSSPVFREHCETVQHRSVVRQPLLQLVCKLCVFVTNHRHEAIGVDALRMEEEQAFACGACAFTTSSASELESHAATHEMGEQCPLCSERPAVLNDHLIQEHKIAESAVERLLAVHRADSQPIAGAAFAFRCPSCTLAFKTEAALQQHSLAHVFKGQNACPFCGQASSSTDVLLEHISRDHPDEEKRLYCELCAESFGDRNAMLSHMHSVGHLHKAKRHLEAGGLDLNSQLAALSAPVSPPEKKPFRCNVCKLGYGQGGTLDVHLRSVAHQSRLAKLSELIASGEVDASKPVTEQPGLPTQLTIAELAGVKDESEVTSANSMAMFNNILNMAQLLNMKPAFSASTSEDENMPKSVAGLRKMIDVIGVDEIPGSYKDYLPRLEELPDESIPDLIRIDCETCGYSAPSYLALKSHCEEAHQTHIGPAQLERFMSKIAKAIDESARSSPASQNGSRCMSRDPSEPLEKRIKLEPGLPNGFGGADPQALMNMLQAGFPFMQPNPFLPMDNFFNPLLAQQLAALQAANNSPAKRARTRITDDQLKVLRQYFDINNSPTEAQIREMSLKTQLPEKVIKHWFRNTLFKERQRDKDSPYNFSIPPQMGIDLDTYEKTGEAKVVPLLPDTNGSTPTPSSSIDREVKQEPKSEPVSLIFENYLHNKEPTNVQATLSAVLQQPALANFMNTLQPNPFSFMQDQDALANFLKNVSGSLPGLPTVPPPTAGRRANRTRFTDFQLRTLQQFFDKQAYPKDDDLELLSKKLQLSPRVIVVWFQNARQKARKIYENQPNLENSDRFVRTPGCNFQCKRCNLVFQRYYELIQHQQKKCYKDDCQAQANDNKGVEGSLTDAEKEQLVGGEGSAVAPQSPALPDPTELLKMLSGKSSTEALLKMCETARTPTSTIASGSFHKRCPFCCLLFRSRQALSDHLPQKHAAQILKAPVDVDLLPSADDVPSLSSTLLGAEGCSAPLDLSNGSNLSDRNDTHSVSPYLGGSDGDDGLDDLSNSFQTSSSTPNGQSESRSPASNKRYRTHLTPVQMMKCIFAEYKTPSMAECDTLGRDIGLHKRVVQVWFQNARAKERKTRMQNGQDDDISRPMPQACAHCGVEYTTRLSLQDHVFSAPHLATLRSLHKADESDVKPTDENGLRNRPPIVRDSSPKKAAAPLNSQAFPFNLLGLGLPQTFSPMMLDQSFIGTPIPMLQIPESVMQQITSDLKDGRSTTKFTQDGLTFDSLIASLPEDDAKMVTPKSSEVGWACPGCSNVFQQEAFFKAHQRLCSSDGCLTLVQTHYECLPCSTQFNTQHDFKAHLTTEEHVTARTALIPVVAAVAAVTAATSSASPLESF